MSVQVAMFPELSAPEKRFLEILQDHQGHERAISVQGMAEALGLGLGKSAQREAQEIKKHLVEEHLVCIGSSCGYPNGWFVPETQEEIDATVRQYENRLKSLARLIAKTKRSTPATVLAQLSLELQEEAA